MQLGLGIYDTMQENGGNYKINFRVENLLNNLYKNYLNRLRYFTHEMGRNILLSVSYNY